jgi:hypothetical protein
MENGLLKIDNDECNDRERGCTDGLGFENERYRTYSTLTMNELAKRNLP